MTQKPVIMLLPYESCSGLELFGLRFAADLQNRGYPVKIAAPGGSLLDQQCRARGLKLWPFPATVKYDLKAWPACYRMLKELDPAAIVAFRTQMMYPLHFARLLARCHPKLFLFYRIGVGNHWRKDPLHRLMFAQISAVVPNADYVCDKIHQFWGIDADKVVCIKSGVDIDKYRPDPDRRASVRGPLGLGPNDVLIGSSGRIHPEKGSEILLRALFEGDGPGRARDNVHLLYVGREYQPGYIAHLQRIAGELGAEKRFHIMDFRNDIETVYSALDLFAFAVTSREAYAYVVLEAMASGVVPVIPATGGMSEMFADRKQGFFFRHKDIDSLKAALHSALAMPPTRLHAMGEAARRHMVATADWHDMMARYLELFKKTSVEGFKRG